MEDSAFYDKLKAQSREDLFKNNSSEYSFINNLFFDLIYQRTPVGAKILDLGTGMPLSLSN